MVGVKDGAIATQGRSYGNLFVGACLSRDGEGGVGKVWVLGSGSAAADLRFSVGGRGFDPVGRGWVGASSILIWLE